MGISFFWPSYWTTQDTSTPNNNMTYTDRINPKDKVDEMINVAKGYYFKRFKKDGSPAFAYGYDGCLSKSYKDTNHIDCSTYAGLVLRGIKIEMSPYYKFVEKEEVKEIKNTNSTEESEKEDKTEKEGNDPDTIPEGNYNPEIWVPNKKDFSWALLPERINKTEGGLSYARSAADIGEWMHSKGWDVDLSDGLFEKVLPGDFIFWAKKEADGTYRQPNRFMHISHVAICVGKYRPPSKAKDPNFPSQYRNKHTTMEVTSKNTVFVNRTLEKCAPDKVVLICRPFLE